MLSNFKIYKKKLQKNIVYSIPRLTLSILPVLQLYFVRLEGLCVSANIAAAILRRDSAAASKKSSKPKTK